MIAFILSLSLSLYLVPQVQASRTRVSLFKYSVSQSGCETDVPFAKLVIVNENNHVPEALMINGSSMEKEHSFPCTGEVDISGIFVWSILEGISSNCCWKIHNVIAIPFEVNQDSDTRNIETCRIGTNECASKGDPDNFEFCGKNVTRDVLKTAPVVFLGGCTIPKPANCCSTNNTTLLTTNADITSPQATSSLTLTTTVTSSPQATSSLYSYYYSNIITSSY
jgi:hypothetical protein